MYYEIGAELQNLLKLFDAIVKGDLNPIDTSKIKKPSSLGEAVIY